MRRKSGAETVLFVDAEQYRSSLQHQVLYPVRHRGLQILLMDQTYDQHSFCETDHQESHADNEVNTYREGERSYRVRL